MKAERTPTSRRPPACSANVADSRRRSPKSFTRRAPDTLKRSVIIPLIEALSAICRRVSACRRRPTRLAGTRNSGSTTIEITATRQSRNTMAAPLTSRVTALDTTEPSVPVTARWAPSTSLLSRLVSAPVSLRVKKATGISCTWSNRATRRS